MKDCDKKFNVKQNRYCEVLRKEKVIDIRNETFYFTHNNSI